jgi:hypothetical protein
VANWAEPAKTMADIAWAALAGMPELMAITP